MCSLISRGNKYAVLAFIPWLVLAPVAVVLVGKMEQMPPGYRVVRFVVHGPGLRAIPQAPGQLICMPHKGARVDFKGSESFLHGRIGAALTDALAVRCALAGPLPSRHSASGSLPISSSEAIAAFLTRVSRGYAPVLSSPMPSRVESSCCRRSHVGAIGGNP
jgi:hypothetical protein